MSPPKMRCRDLPPYLQKRIAVGPGRESKACWIWTGKVKAARQRYRPYSAIEGDGDGNGYREHAGRFTNEAAVPLVRPPLTKNYEDARRHVYGAATMSLVCDVPTLQRCENPRCVSPHHVIPGAPTAAQRKRLNPRPEIGLELEIYTHERCMELLRAASGGEGVNWGTTKDEAADEAGIPRDQLTEECWAHYVREEMAKEDEENDDAD